jgi:3-oxoacyl-[acyl-carrier protein] reductase
VALVTGAARGIGRAICERLARDGAAVSINYSASRRKDEAETLMSAIRQSGGSAIAVQADVSNALEVATMVQETVRVLGPITILVNNAAITRVHRPWTDIDEQEWDQVMATNVKGAFLCSRAVHRYMREAAWGRVINIGSVTFLTGQRNLTHYVASKGALIGFTRSLAREVGGEGITVNCVSPGAIRTEMEVEIFPDQTEIALDLLQRQAIPRRGTPVDIAAAVAFLASDDASFITGQLINVDGGLAMH